MSHYDFINLTQMTEPRAAFVCARLNLRFGKRRLQKGLTVAGIIALYDSILFGMQYYIISHKHCASLVEKVDLRDAAGLFDALTRAGVFDDPLVFNRFSLMVERALWQESFLLDAGTILAEVETILAKLGVGPLKSRTAHYVYR
jgi:hypothetical protein